MGVADEVVGSGVSWETDDFGVDTGGGKTFGDIRGLLFPGINQDHAHPHLNHRNPEVY